ncbi:MAG: DUF512 domain-containing protein, partial [Clostridia bacterium]|nr:DUF512 domain-containing protein [Clostridia bacterium]
INEKLSNVGFNKRCDIQFLAFKLSTIINNSPFIRMLRSLRDEFDFELSEMKKYGEEPDGAISVSIATGYAAYNQISEMKKILERAFPEIKISLYPIKNNYFGEHITVAGLLTGKDIFEQLEGKELGERLLIPANALRYEKDLFLCGMSVDELKEKLGVDIIPTENDGYSFVSAILCRE